MNYLISAKVPEDAHKRRLALGNPKWGYLVMRGIRAMEEEPENNARFIEMEKKISSAIAVAQKYAQAYYAITEAKAVAGWNNENLL